jgi:hypothetical protein
MRTTKLTKPPGIRRSVFALAILALGSLFVLAAGFWEWKPYMEWSEEETVTMLTDSPWARTHTTVRNQFRLWNDSHDFRPWDSPCDCREALTALPVVATKGFTSSYYVRFQTASPIRRAVSRLWFLKDRISREQVEELVQSAPFERHIVVVVTAAPELAQSELDTICTASLQDAMCVLSLEDSGRSIPLCQYVSPRQAGTGEAYFVFPRVRVVEPEETVVSFDCRINEEIRLLCDFRLGEMWFEGRLEI